MKALVSCLVQSNAVAATSSEWWGDGGLEAEPPAASRGRAPGQGVREASPNQNVGGTCPPVPPIIAAPEAMYILIH